MTTVSGNTGKTYTKVQSSSGIKYIKAGELAKQGVKGLILEGTYLGPIPSNFDETKSDFRFELEDKSLTIVNHTGQLASLMRQVSPGSVVLLSYIGSETITSGKMKGKAAHRFEVQVAND